eukprot:SAG31_NODE_6885_length_1860_cov_3.093129_2_plen_84_part_00
MSAEELALQAALKASMEDTLAAVTEVEAGADGRSVTRTQLDPIVAEMAAKDDFMEKSMKTIREELGAKLDGAGPVKLFAIAHA